MAAGQTGSVATSYEFLTIRYNIDGSLDNTFDGDGKVVTPFGVLGSERPDAVLVQPNGGIVLAGSIIDTFNADLALVRHNADGSPDTTFDIDGKEILELGNAADGVYDTAVQPDGKIVTVGYAFDGARPQPAVARFLANGTVDTTFGNQGSLRMQYDQDTYADDVVVQPDGKIVFSLGTYEGHPYIAVRLNPDGSFDSSFGTSGVATVPVSGSGSSDSPYGLALQTDGKILIAGTSNSGRPTIVRLTTSGTLDGTFGTGGIAQAPSASVFGSVNVMALQPDGKIILVGGAPVPTFNDTSFFTTRYNTNGSIDTSYGGTGAVYTSVGSGFEAAVTVAVQSDGKILVAGRSSSDAAAVRYNSNGTLDNSFDGDGKVVVPGHPTLYDEFSDVATQADGRIVFVGRERRAIGTLGYEESDSLVFRFNADGTRDSSFGSNGRVKTGLGGHDSRFYSVKTLPDGKILAGGLSSNGNNNDFTLVRYVGGSGRWAPFDFDGDGKTDVGIFRPSVGEWWINRSSTGVTVAGQFGVSSDVITPGDFTGDGKADIAFFRPSTGEWFVLRSEDSSYFSFPFGTNGDIPAPADFDADGKTDPTVFRPSTGVWYSGAHDRRDGDTGIRRERRRSGRG